ncbi:peptidase family C50-domain-containing protein [Hypoxylon sp. NC1633]|nr:peptidase family C50-domain-containing protein [Hypoxylon sp. NC1633]
MDSLNKRVDAVRDAVASVSTCTSTISLTLKELLQSAEINETLKPTSKARPVNTAQPSNRPRSASAAQRNRDNEPSLTPKEKAVLATQVITAALKALGDAAKEAPAPTQDTRETPKNGTAKLSSRTSFGRSNSAPLKPLQDRSLNRVTSSPLTPKAKPIAASTGCISMIECTRTAFSALRALQASKSANLPDLQLESAWSSFINKLIALDLFESATRELRTLKQRLERIAYGGAVKDTKTRKGPEPNVTSRTLSDLLDFTKIKVSSPLLGLVISTQLQTLRIIHGLKKSAHLESALPFLRESCPTSPLNLLLTCLKDENPDQTKCARQLETLSQNLLSLTPSISPKDDDLAVEPRLYPSPKVSLEVQALGFVTRLQSWSVSGYRGDVDKDVLGPLSRCMGTFARRTSSNQYPAVFSAFSQVWERVEKLGLRPTESSRSPLAATYQVLAVTSRESGNTTEGLKWLTKLRSLIDPSQDSAARCCAVTAQLLALSLKESSGVDENLLKEVLEGMKGSLGGTVAEINDLLLSVCLLRRSVMNLLTAKQGGPVCISKGHRELLETFIFQLPRFTLKWLGNPPSSDKGAKDKIHFEQRRGLLSEYVSHILDSALMLAKMLMDDERLGWDVLDTTLQVVLAIVENMGDFARPGTKINPSPFYHVKVSHLYYQQHLVLRKSASKATEIAYLKALRKSIETVKTRSEEEQDRALLLDKWEVFVDLCKSAGRRDDAIDALRSMRDHLVRRGIVSGITTNLASQPWSKAWQQNHDVELLSRTVRNIAMLDQKINDWTWLLTGLDKATALEHDFYAIIAGNQQHHRGLNLSTPIVQKLLEYFSAERYPVRRLRIIVTLLLLSIENGVDEIRPQADAVLTTITDETLAEDSGLASYVPHLRGLATCMICLADMDINTREVKGALANWKSMVSKCQSADQLSAYVDNLGLLLVFLQSLIDYASLKGLETLQTNILELSVSILKLIADGSSEGLVTQSIALCMQYLSLGQSSKAEKLIKDNYELISQPDMAKELVVQYYLSAAEYHLSLGSLDQAEQFLSDAQNVESSLSSEPGSKRMSSEPGSKRKNASRRITKAYAYAICSNLSLERGDCYHALQFAKTAVKKLFHDWSRMTDLCAAHDASMEGSSQTEATEMESRRPAGPEFWVLAYPLFRFLLQLSSVYAHVGLYQETLYYAQQAEKVARGSDSTAYISRCLAWLSWVWLMAGEPGKAMEHAAETMSTIAGQEPTYQHARVLCRLGAVYGEIGDSETQEELITKAESMLKTLNENDDTTGLESAMEGLKIEEKPVVKATVRRTATRKPRAATKNISKKPEPKRANIPTEATVQAKSEETQLSFLRASILQNQSLSLLAKKHWGAAVSTLRTVHELSKLPIDISQACFLMGVALTGQSLDQMGSDAVFSVMQDSTLSFPSVAVSLKGRTTPDRLSLPKTAAPARKTRGAKNAQNNARSFVEKLREAQGHLLTAHSIACLNGNGDMVHRIATALQNVVILLSNTNIPKPAASHPAHATCSVELARNLTWRRERKTVRLESPEEMKLDWPIPTSYSAARRTSLGLSLDMDRFQRDFIDIIPKSWNVVSISVGDGEHDLCITKLQPGQSPFGIRLPLQRASSRDADSHVFSFQEGREELLDIIKNANRTCHSARDISEKAAKLEWWAEREELDRRLGNLMESIEHTWLGGFKGIFSPHRKHKYLFAKFEKAFQDILDKYLPSRQQVRGRRAKTTPPPTRVNLDPRIYDLFIGLCDPTDPEGDLDEPLEDLLYFVMDILQFHGERNALDEIDFDEMVIKTYNAMHAYHTSAKSIEDAREDVHTILILDKSLHTFPWESLPCMQGQAVSRVPSLDCLRRLILEAKPAPSDPINSGEDKDEDKDGDQSSVSSSSSSSSSRTRPRGPRAGHHASINSGTYILNPNCDLKHTQATFGPALAGLPASWNSVEMREPQESEFEAALTERDLLLYFGHGSGAQYVRGRTIRGMPKCRAVALLMGCSSASLADVGRFECHGPVWNYMLAGCPAVVGTLWDVTDRDIDRFAAAVFEGWGLFAAGSFAEKGMGFQKGEGEVMELLRGSTSLVEAVAWARDACRFRYLTAAAVCVYGIPVFLCD